MCIRDRPYEDGCTIFVAKHPVTKPNVDVIRRSEEKLEEKIGQLFQKAVDTVEIIEVESNTKDCAASAQSFPAGRFPLLFLSL